jgi:hypothetical protein
MIWTDPIACGGLDTTNNLDAASWFAGDRIVRREVIDGRSWLEYPQIVIHDSAELLVAYTPPGAPFEFPAGTWPTANGMHPWHGSDGWQGHGALHLMWPGVQHAVWVFWVGADRHFAHWYINIQEPFRRTSIGYDTQDLELDLVVEPNGTWWLKDAENLVARIDEGRLSADQGAAAISEAARLAELLDDGRWWWDRSWAFWRPDRGSSHRRPEGT